MRCLGEDVENLADAVWCWVGQMKATSIQTFLVCEMIECARNEVDGNDVDAASFDANRRHPGRQHLAHALNQSEEVVRPVDLVDKACLRVSDDEAGPVDSPRPLAFVAHDAFCEMLGPEIRMIQFLGFLEHVLPESAVVKSSGCDRAYVVKAAGVYGIGKADRVTGAFNVRYFLNIGARVDIVNRSQVKDVLDLPFEPRKFCFAHPKLRLRQIAGDGHYLRLVDTPLLAQRSQFLLRALAYEHVDRFAALQQIIDQKAANETGAAGDKISHFDSSPQAAARNGRRFKRSGFDRSGRSSATGRGIIPSQAKSHRTPGKACRLV